MYIEKQVQEKYNLLGDFINANKKRYLIKNVKDVDYYLFENVNLGEGLKHIGKRLQKELQERDTETKVQYNEMKFYVDNHYNNILFTGFGSKYDFITEFVETQLNEYPSVTINGFMNGISLKYILNKLCTFLTHCSSKYHDEDTEDQAKAIKRTKIQQIQYIKDVLGGDDLDFEYDRVIIVIHSLDGKALRNTEIQQTLSEIAYLRKVTMIATVDNYYFQTLLTPQILENFNFKIFLMDNFQLYHKEFTFVDDNSQNPKKKGAEGLIYILKSFTKNQKDIVKTMAKYLMENPTSPGLEFKALFKLCYDETIVSTESQLKQNMVEILDHKILREIKGEKGKILFFMDFSRVILDQIINNEFE